MRGSTRTIRASVSASPDTSPTIADPVTDDDAAPAQLAGLHGDHLAARLGPVDAAGHVTEAARVAAPVDGDDVARARRPRGWAGPWCAAASRATGGRGRRPRRARARGADRCRQPEQLRPEVDEARQGLAGGRDVVHLDAGHPQAEHGGGGGEPMVVVRREQPAVQRPRLDRRGRPRSRCTSPPSAVISAASAASRSVSWWRRCAMPRSVEGPSASAQIAAITGVSSPTSRRSASMPVSTLGTGDGQAARGRARTCRASALQQVRSTSPAWRGAHAASPGTVTRPPVTMAAARNGAALDRSGSTAQRRRRAAGPARPASDGLRVSRRATPAARSISTVIAMCGADGTGGPSWRTSMPLVEAGRGEQQAGDELATTRRRRG